MPESPDIRRKRLLFRSRQRGMLETSLLLRAFADRYLAELDGGQLDGFEALLEANDNDLLDWVVGKKAVPATIDGALVDLIKNFRKNI
ncbi:FAD assembly factor SdhE [Shumkonia mesophila]|uniref:FAD assembly factor SdhE n=1 Tax=Shumkonia mesophila TaxID=2838854 RepID=UPI0029350855|nr:succinate dehydrogenase assembly factor 2 [Shumkonia mesophila]